MVRPLSTGNTRGKGCAVAFLAVFILFTGLFSVMFTVRPTIAVVGARSWEPRSCVVISSALRTTRSGDGDVFDLDLRYRWDHAGRTFVGTRYDLTGIKTGAREHWLTVLDGLKPNQAITCFVNPRSPSDATINRGLTGGYFLATGVTGLFLLLGVLGLVKVLRWGRPRRRGEPARIDDSLRAPVTSIPERQGLIPLSPRSSGRGRLVVMAIFAVFWNGFVTTVTIERVAAVRDGTAAWWELAWWAPFVAVGLWSAYRFLHAAARAILPQIQMFQVNQPARLGQPLSVRWQVTPAPRRRVPFEVTLLGQEVITTRRSSDNRALTRRSAFKRLAFVPEETGEYGQGAATVLVPADTVPSLRAASNEIEWVVVVDARFVRWPHVREDFPITLLPPRRA